MILHPHVSRWKAQLTEARLQKLWYVPVLALAMAMMMARMLVMARLLDVPHFAEFSLGILISGTFCMLGCLGLQAMLQREWPVNILRRQENRGLILAAQSTLVAIACALVGILISAFGVSPAGISPALLAVGLLHGLSQQWFLLASLESRSRGAALDFSMQNLARSAGSLLIGVLVALALRSATAVLVAEAAFSIALSVVLVRKSVARGSVSVKALQFLALRGMARLDWKTAATLMAVTAIAFVILNADRWVGAVQLGVEEFARYSFAWIILIVAQSVQAVAAASIYPLLARRAVTHGRSSAFRICSIVTGGVLAIGLVCLGPLLWLSEFVIVQWFPAYAEALHLLTIFYLIGLLRAADFWSSYLLVIGRERTLLLANVLVLVGCATAWAFFVRPWDAAASAQQVAMLALGLTVCSYVAGAAASLALRK